MATSKYKRRMTLEFEGFEEVVARLSKLEGDVKTTTERALKETHRIVTKKAEAAIQPHRLSGMTENSLKREANIEWAGTLASVPVGFSISEGGLASIFLMYGTPTMQKDQKLYNAIWGKATHDEVSKIQEDIFFEEIRKLGG